MSGHGLRRARRPSGANRSAAADGNDAPRRYNDGLVSDRTLRVEQAHMFDRDRVAELTRETPHQSRIALAFDLQVPRV